MASNQRSITPNFRTTISRDATQRVNRRQSFLRPSFSVDLNRTSFLRGISPSRPLHDDDIICDLASSEYLQAIMKKQIVDKSKKKLDEEINDQIILQKDNLQKSKLLIKNVEERLTEKEVLEQAEAILTTLDETLNKFTNLTEKENLFEILEKLHGILDKYSKTLIIENVQAPTTQKFFDVFYKILLQCENLNLQVKNSNHFGKLVELLKKVRADQDFLVNKQIHLQVRQSEVVSKLLKKLSDMYASAEEYEV